MVEQYKTLDEVLADMDRLKDAANKRWNLMMPRMHGRSAIVEKWQSDIWPVVNPHLNKEEE